MHAALLCMCMLRCYAYTNKHVYVEQALNHSINMCYASAYYFASELRQVSCGKIVNG